MILFLLSQKIDQFGCNIDIGDKLIYFEKRNLLRINKNFLINFHILINKRKKWYSNINYLNIAWNSKLFKFSDRIKLYRLFLK